MTVTLRQLKECGACKDGLDRFRMLFGTKAARVTRRRLAMFGADLDWFVLKLLPWYWHEYCDAYFAIAARRPAWPESSLNVAALADVLGLK